LLKAGVSQVEAKAFADLWDEMESEFAGWENAGDLNQYDSQTLEENDGDIGEMIANEQDLFMVRYTEAWLTCDYALRRLKIPKEVLDMKDYFTEDAFHDRHDFTEENLKDRWEKEVKKYRLKSITLEDARKRQIVEDFTKEINLEAKLLKAGVSQVEAKVICELMDEMQFHLRSWDIAHEALGADSQDSTQEVQEQESSVEYTEAFMTLAYGVEDVLRLPKEVFNMLEFRCKDATMYDLLTDEEKKERWDLKVQEKAREAVFPDTTLSSVVVDKAKYSGVCKILAEAQKFYDKASSNEDMGRWGHQQALEAYFMEYEVFEYAFQDDLKIPCAVFDWKSLFVKGRDIMDQRPVAPWGFDKTCKDPNTYLSKGDAGDRWEEYCNEEGLDIYCKLLGAGVSAVEAKAFADLWDEME